MAVLIWPNTEKFNASVRDGTLDYTLLQPVNSMFLVTFSRMVIWRVWDLVLGAVLIVVGIRHERRRRDADQPGQLPVPGDFWLVDPLQPVDRADRRHLLVHQVRQQCHHPAGAAGYRAATLPRSTHPGCA